MVWTSPWNWAAEMEVSAGAGVTGAGVTGVGAGVTVALTEAPGDNRGLPRAQDRQTLAMCPLRPQWWHLIWACRFLLSVCVEEPQLRHRLSITCHHLFRFSSSVARGARTESSQLASMSIALGSRNGDDEEPDDIEGAEVRVEPLGTP